MRRTKLYTIRMSSKERRVAEALAVRRGLTVASLLRLLLAEEARRGKK